MPEYTTHKLDPGKEMDFDIPLGTVETCYRLRALKELGFEQMTLRNYETGDEITEVEKFLRDNARP